MPKNPTPVHTSRPATNSKFRLKSTALLSAAIAMALLTPAGEVLANHGPAQLPGIEWKSDTGGLFDDGNNWDGGTPPSLFNLAAIFNQPDSGTVDFSHGPQMTNGLVIDGRASFDLTNSQYDAGQTYVGSTGPGELDISGGLLNSSSSQVGTFDGGSGQVTVSGPGTQWNSGDLVVHQGSMLIENGGRVESAAATVYGDLTVSGSNSQWHAASIVNEGIFNLAGGQVTTGNLSSAMPWSIFDHSDGTLEVTGQLELQANGTDPYMGTPTYNIDGQSGAHPTIDLNGGNWSLDPGTALHIGETGQGTLKVRNGGQLITGAETTLGSHNSQGSLQVSGVGSHLQAGEGLYVQGNSTFSIEAGASAQTGEFFNGGTTTLRDATSQWNATSVENWGAFNLAGGQLTAGNFTSLEGANFNHSDGTLEVTGQLDLQPAVREQWGEGIIHIAGQNGGHATIDLNGGDWMLAPQTHVTIGNGGQGTLTVRNGGQVTSNMVLVYGSNDGQGTLQVTGPGSTLTSSDYLFTESGNISIDDAGAITTTNFDSAGGSLQISGGGQFNSQTSRLFADAQVTLNDSGSRWQSDDLTVGYTSNADITLNGGELISSQATLGSNGGQGSVTVRGTDASWQTNQLTVGTDSPVSTGTLFVAQGGSVSVTGDLDATHGSVMLDGGVIEANRFTGWLHQNDGTLRVYQELALGETGRDPASGSYAHSIDGRNGGHAIVDLQGASWTASAGLFGYTGPTNLLVGNEGQGSLIVENGAQVDSNNTVIGVAAGSTGAVRVSGSGSQLINHGNLTVGRDGGGALTVDDSGWVDVAGELAIGVNGAVSITDGMLATGSDTRISVGGQLALSGNAAQMETVSLANAGSLTVTNGGLLTVSGAVTTEEFASVTLNGGAIDAGRFSATAPLSQFQHSDGTLRITELLELQANGTAPYSGTPTYNIGSQSSGNPIINLDGASWTLDPGTQLQVGGNGQGTLILHNGAEMTSSSSQIGTFDGGSGQVTVSGPGTQWNSGDLVVHQGSVLIENGGRVESAAATVYGDLTVSGSNSQWHAASIVNEGIFNLAGGQVTTGNLSSAMPWSIFDHSDGTLEVTGQLELQANGTDPYMGTPTYNIDGQSGAHPTIDLNGGNWSLDPGTALHIGETGQGTLKVRNGGQLITGAETTLGSHNSQGSLQVSGVGSHLQAGEGLYVQGNSTFSIEAGASAQTGEFFNGGTTTLRDATSQWNATSVENWGAFNLAGGQLTAGNFTSLEGANFNHSDGTLEVTGQLDLQPAVREQWGEGIIHIAGQNGGHATIDLNGGDWMLAPQTHVTIGNGGQGTLTVRNGGQVTSNMVLVYGSNDGQGTLQVTGPGSTLTSSDYLFTESGNISIDDAGAITTTNFDSAGGSLQISGGGQFNSQTSRLFADAQVTLNDSGSRWQSDDLTVGYTSNADITLNGGELISSQATLGSNGGQGSVTVRGTDASWQTNQLTVGTDSPVSTGTLFVAQGGSVSVTGDLDATHGSVMLDGGVIEANRFTGWLHQNDGTLRVYQELALGETGRDPASGSYAHSIDGRNGGHAIVDLQGASWTASAGLFGYTGPTNLLVGNEGQGNLIVENGAQVDSNNTVIGVAAGSTGAVRVSGSGSQLINHGNLTVGRDGSGTLTVADNGLVDVAHQLSIGNIGSVTLDGGILQAHTIDNMAGGQLNLLDGTLKAVDFLGDLNNSSGTFSPGASPAISSITGDYLQGAGATLQIELAGTNPGEFDQLIVSGMASLAGTLEIILLDGFLPSEGDSFTFLEAGWIEGAFDSFILPDIGSNLFDISFNGGYGQIQVSGVAPVPLPAAAWLFLSALGGLGYVGRRRKKNVT